MEVGAVFNQGIWLFTTSATNCQASNEWFRHLCSEKLNC